MSGARIGGAPLLNWQLQSQGRSSYLVRGETQAAGSSPLRERGASYAWLRPRRWCLAKLEALLDSDGPESLHVTNGQEGGCISG